MPAPVLNNRKEVHPMALSDRSVGVSPADTIDATGPDPVAVGVGADRHGRNAEHPTEIPGAG